MGFYVVERDAHRCDAIDTIAEQRPHYAAHVGDAPTLSSHA